MDVEHSDCFVERCGGERTPVFADRNGRDAVGVPELFADECARQCVEHFHFTALQGDENIPAALGKLDVIDCVSLAAVPHDFLPCVLVPQDSPRVHGPSQDVLPVRTELDGRDCVRVTDVLFQQHPGLQVDQASKLVGV